MTSTTHSNTFFAAGQYPGLPEQYRPIIITDHFKAPDNVGHIIRLAANIDALKVLVLTDNPYRKSKINKTAGAAISSVEIHYITQDQLWQYIPEDYILTGLETSQDSQNIFSTQLPAKLAVVLGNEQFGINHQLLQQCNMKVHIPMPGIIKSMNVSHAASVCLFQWYNQHVEKFK
ncbi:TrmH family RNA methyltransferase [Marinilabiliaceae bacterium JC017]|nr:TrmH family RNA methyltransferase [Marinilabiliaceae bacterium JC017]